MHSRTDNVMRKLWRIAAILIVVASSFAAGRCYGKTDDRMGPDAEKCCAAQRECETALDAAKKK